MAQLVLGAAGAAAGGALFPSGLTLFGAHLSGAAIGGFAGAMAGGAAMRALDNRRFEGPRIEELAIQSSADGAPVPLVYGRARIAGQVIWASRFRERRVEEKAGGKGGGPRVVHHRYSVSFAVGLCEGVIGGVGRVWANGAALDLSEYEMRIHPGTEDQASDPLIEAVEGAQNAPAFRGLAYAVFEDMPLDAFGDRIPNLSFEVFRAPGAADDGPRLENLVRGVDLIPGSGEFAYAPYPVMREEGPGRERAENVNNGRGAADLIAALDDLQARLPECNSVLLVSSWFGTDLRCGQCEIRPGVETRDKITRPLSWAVAGETRATAYLVSEHDGRPVYGGTPDDASLIDCIKELKSRGFSVSLYPFILMDVPPGNALPDPWGGAEQAAFPWRGRISCHPAPGMDGSPDKTAAAGAQVDAFFGAAQAADFTVSGPAVFYSGPEEWRFNRFILHHAALAAAAGGVDGFLIGSEMRSLTQVRDGPAAYPAVARLKALAAQARALLGAATRLSYAADWSEYSGHQPQDGSGDVFFHLDPLWTDENIDAVAIDWYAPLADWRDGADHLDALAGAASIHDRGYLAANVEGGEGFDWFYASAEDRLTQTRTPITDGAHDEPWVFRFKDLRNWWANEHHDRPGGVREDAPTAWVPQSKPVWVTELGCPAVDKGANQPNVFLDPKSAESVAPHFSTRARDDLIQRRYLEAFIDYWRPQAGNNPVSSVYGQPMIDWGAIHVWTWDARPFPDFPARTDVWSDGPNWRTGHWLSGRAGLSPLQEVVADLCARAGLDEADVTGVDGVLAGYVVDRPMPARDALSPLAAAFGFVLADRADGPAFLGPPPAVTHAFTLADLAAEEAGAAFRAERVPHDALPRDARLRFIEDAGDYRPASAYARWRLADHAAVLDASWPLLADAEQARGFARGLLASVYAGAETVSLTLPPSLLAFEAGDVFTLSRPGGAAPLRIQSLSGGAARRAELTAWAEAPAPVHGPQPGSGGDAVSPPAMPDLLLLDLPLLPGEDADRGGPLAAVFADPWFGEAGLYAGADDESLSLRARAAAAAMTGELLGALPPGLPGRWDRANTLRLKLYAGELASEPALMVLNGANALAVQGPQGWEIIQFLEVVLTGPGEYTLSGLLRGQAGTETGETAPAGARVAVLNPALTPLPLGGHERAAPLRAAAVAVTRPPWHDGARRKDFVYHGADLRPLAPAHLRARRGAEGVEISWIRRSRLGGDDWAAVEIALGEAFERYRLELLDDDAVIHAAETAEPHFLIPPALESALYGGQAQSLSVRVAQISDRYGPGRAAHRVLPL